MESNASICECFVKLYAELWSKFPLTSIAPLNNLSFFSYIG